MKMICFNYKLWFFKTVLLIYWIYKKIDFTHQSSMHPQKNKKTPKNQHGLTWKREEKKLLEQGSK